MPHSQPEPPQWLPRGGHDSFIMPSQSSSPALQVSSVEPVASEHRSMPPTHDHVPSVQTSVSEPSHIMPSSGSSAPSSDVRSQSSFVPLHTSSTLPVMSLQTTPVPGPLHT